MADCKGIVTPMCSSSPPRAGDNLPLADAILYWNTLGKLQNLSFTCLDIVLVGNKLYQFMQSPRLEHWKAVKKGYLISQVIINIVLANILSF